jgi:hypothetical protein
MNSMEDRLVVFVAIPTMKFLPKNLDTFMSLHHLHFPDNVESW